MSICVSVKNIITVSWSASTRTACSLTPATTSAWAWCSSTSPESSRVAGCTWTSAAETATRRDVPRLLVSCGAVRVRAPERPGVTAGTNPPIDCWFIRIWEPCPPERVEPLEWVLYTDEPTETLEVALVGVMDYATRFLIEEFHKGMKTGLRIEALQLETGPRLFAAIAVMSIVALRLVDLRELGRAVPEAPAKTTGLSDPELELLSLAVNRTLTTVASVLLAIGRLGGHMNRKSDGMPGWITLWRGMKKLRLLVKGAELERMRIDKYVHS